MKMSHVLMAGVAAGSMALALASPANAALMVRVSDFVNAPQTVTDNGAGDANGVGGAIQFTFDNTDFNIAVQSGNGTVTPLAATMAPLELHLNAQTEQANNTDQVSVMVELTLTDIDPGVDGQHLNFFISDAVSGLDGTVDYAAFLDTSNAAFGQGTQLSSTSLDSAGTGTNSNFSMFLSGPFSLTATYIINLNDPSGPSSPVGATNATQTITLVEVPEPATLSLLGMGLIGLGAAARRRRNA